MKYRVMSREDVVLVKATVYRFTRDFMLHIIENNAHIYHSKQIET